MYSFWYFKLSASARGRSAGSLRYAEDVEEEEDGGAPATEDCVDGGGCWERGWVLWEAAGVGVAGVLVGVKEERLVAID